ncbi:MAG: tyrosinase family protein [Anaerolineae bacterium]|nr:tyrosinase family protein [Anaerolineae bacterium]
MAIRKSVNSLTAQERADYVRGVKLMKANGRYDRFVRIHASVQRTPTINAAHMGPAFLPWHRQFILEFERDLQSALGNPDFGLPYWDWAADSSLAPTAMSVWQLDLLGPNGTSEAGRNPVLSGEFRRGQWVIVPSGPGQPTFLERTFAQDTPSLPNQAGVDAALALTLYDTPPFNQTSTNSFRNQLEGWVGPQRLHNNVHVWVGGSMSPLTSPNDPVFFLHHCNVDRIWAQWQLCSSTPQYLPVTGGPTGHNRDDQMWPWNGSGFEGRTTRVRPRDVDNHRALGYFYDTEVRRQTVTLRRSGGARFVSPQSLRLISPCASQAPTSSTLFIPSQTGGVLRAERTPLNDQITVEG